MDNLREQITSLLLENREKMEVRGLGWVDLKANRLTKRVQISSCLEAYLITRFPLRLLGPMHADSPRIFSVIRKISGRVLSAFLKQSGRPDSDFTLSTGFRRHTNACGELGRKLQVNMMVMLEIYGTVCLRREFLNS